MEWGVRVESRSEQQAAMNNHVRAVIYLITIALLCMRLQSLYGTLALDFISDSNEFDSIRVFTVYVESM